MNDVAMRSTLEILKAARERISDPNRWHRGGYAFGRGREVKPNAKSARQWCALGALWRELGCDPVFPLKMTAGEPGRLLFDAAKYLYGRRMDRVNDCEGHVAVLEVYDRAIRVAAAESEALP